MNDEQMQPLLEVWLHDRDEAPQDPNVSIARVIGRLPKVRQRGRWWPLPALRRKAKVKAKAPTTNDMTFYRPSPVPASNGHAPTIIGRTRLMFSPVKAITTGALIFALGGLFLVAQPFEQQGSVPGAEQGADPTSTATDAQAPARVTGVLKASGRNQQPEVSQSPTEFASSPFVTVTTNFGWTMQLETDDPRLSGTFETNQNIQQYGTSAGVRTGIGRLTNEGGSWAAESHGFAVTGGDAYVHFLAGEGPYEGLSAMLLTLPAESDWEVTGVIAPDPWPEPPEWVLPPTE